MSERGGGKSATGGGPAGTVRSEASLPVTDRTDGQGWCLYRPDYDPATEECAQTLFCLANGVLGVRGGCEEAGGSGGCFLAEVYGRTPIHYHERFTGFAATTDTRLPVADGTAVDIWIEDMVLDPASPDCVAFEREFDLRSGVLRRTTRWRAPGGGQVELCTERVVPLGRGAVVGLRLSLHSIGFRGEVRLESMLRGDRTVPAQGDDPRIGIGGGTGLRTLWIEADQDLPWLMQITPCGRVRVACGQRHGVPGGGLRVDRGVAVENDRLRQVFRATLEPGGCVRLEKFIAYAWDGAGTKADADALRSALERALEKTIETGFDGLLADQSARLARFWRDAAIDIQGDAAAEQALRFNLFHLMQSTPGEGVTSTAAKGLTGDGYEGHIFWDTEAYMLPVLALTAPELARSMLEFRHRTLDGAHRHAREMNHRRGALYPWRTIGGGECSGYFPSGSAQYHINAAVAHAIGVYLAASGDGDFLLRGGAEMLFETARIWLEIGHFNPRRDGAFCLCEVTGPDEYSALVDNNFYTNLMAREHLRQAVRVWERLGAQAPEERAALAARLDLDEGEVGRWRQAATAMYLPYDEHLGIHPQDDGFLDKPVWDFAATPPSHRPLLLHYHPLTLYRHQVCKQADVVLALVLAGDAVDADVKRRCFDYYRTVTVHDSTLSAAPFGVLAAELGQAEAARAFFEDTLRVDLDDLHGNTGHGAHMAAMAGSWHVLAFGFAGLRIDGEWLRFAPSLPGHWRGYGFGLRWRGRRLRLEVDPELVRYTLLEGSPLRVSDRGQEVALEAGSSVAVRFPESARWPLLRPPVPLRAVIFDLDGVLTDTARVHYRAWKRLADELGIEFDERINRRLKGVDRMASLEILLERAGRRFDDAEKAELAARKNGYYRDQIEHFTPGDLLPGALEAVAAVGAAGLKIGLASASRNAPRLLERLGIADRFDFIADPATVERGKPAPDIFLAAARGLGVEPAACLGIEDAAAGVAAIKAAGMAALGIGGRRELSAADAVLPGLDGFRIETVLRPDPGPEPDSSGASLEG